MNARQKRAQFILTLIVIASTLLGLFANPSPAYAWHGDWSVNRSCNEDGSTHYSVSFDSQWKPFDIEVLSGDSLEGDIQPGGSVGGSVKMSWSDSPNESQTINWSTSAKDCPTPVQKHGNVDVVRECNPDGSTHYVVTPRSDWPGYEVEWQGAPPEGDIAPGGEVAGTAVFSWDDGQTSVVHWSTSASECPKPETYKVKITGDTNCDGWTTEATASPDGATITYEPAQTGNWENGQESVTVVATAKWANGKEATNSITLDRPDCKEPEKPVGAAPMVCVGDILATDYRLDTDSESDILIRWLDRSTMTVICQKNITKAIGPGDDTHPSISPDGKFVVWSRLVEGQDFPTLWTAKVDGNNAQPLLDSEGKEILGVHPDWNAEGNLIAFVDGSFQIRVYDLDKEVFLTDIGSGEMPDWAPDERLAYNDGGRAYFGNADDSLKNVVNPCMLSRWSPDGTLDCVTSFDYPKVMNLDFEALQAKKVDEAVDISRDHAGTSWAALIVSNDGHQLVIKNLATGQVSFTSSSLYEEMNPDWWSASVQTNEQPVNQESDVLSFKASLDESITYTIENIDKDISPIVVTDKDGIVIPAPETVQAALAATAARQTVCPGYAGVSLVECLAQAHMDFSFTARAQMALVHGLISSIDQYDPRTNGDINWHLVNLLRGTPLP